MLLHVPAGYCLRNTTTSAYFLALEWLEAGISRQVNHNLQYQVEYY